MIYHRRGETNMKIGRLSLADARRSDLYSPWKCPQAIDINEGKGNMKKILWYLLAAVFFWGTASSTLAQQQSPTLTVFGQGEVSAPPDEAVVRLGAVAQAARAADAQDQVNAAVQKLLMAIQALGIPAEKVATVELSIAPLYGDPRGREEKTEPMIVGYRASNVVRVKIEDLKILGRVVDAGLASGANRVEGISFGLRDDREHRRRALGLAAGDAKSKAESIAKAMGVKLATVRSVTEGGADLIRPQTDSAPRLAAMAAPISPGQLQIKASLTVSYDIVEVKIP
jgi:uncharacterized protein